MLGWGADAAAHLANGQFSLELLVLFLEPGDLCSGFLAALLVLQPPMQLFLLAHSLFDMGKTLLVVLHRLIKGFILDY